MRKSVSLAGSINDKTASDWRARAAERATYDASFNADIDSALDALRGFGATYAREIYAGAVIGAGVVAALIGFGLA